jgi:hypothetical protein
MVASVRAAVSEAVQNLLTEIPPYGSSAQRRADFLLLKAEVFDLIAAVSDACVSAQARDLASHARYEARSVGREGGQW